LTTSGTALELTFAGAVKADLFSFAGFHRSSGLPGSATLPKPGKLLLAAGAVEHQRKNKEKSNCSDAWAHAQPESKNAAKADVMSGFGRLRVHCRYSWSALRHRDLRFTRVRIAPSRLCVKTKTMIFVHGPHLAYGYWQMS
jgi:hypothetical protein